ncbi:MAG: peptidoglycan-binding protein [Paenibacillaceae bacterium]|nr:peptidoglycan-binding protein [Paenibacillaceae bacterium]
MNSSSSAGRRKLLPLAALLLCLVLVTVPAATAAAFGQGSSGSDVYAVQGMLKSLGYFNGTITGYYGTQTAAAVKKFQARYGLPKTGAVDNKTLESILWAYANMKLPKQPAPKPTPVPTPAPTPVPVPEPSAPPQNGLSAEEQQMVDLVNAARESAGLPPLTVNGALANVARTKSKDMADNGYFSHQSPTYGSPFDMMKQFGITYRTAGENIACNQSVEAAHQALMNSEGHRANILSSEFTEIGIGIVNGGTCGKMFTQQFIGQ